MRKLNCIWVGLVAVCLCGVGCGDSASDTGSSSGPGGAGEAPTEPGEVVVEPSETTLVIDGAETQSVEVVKELLAEGAGGAPIGYMVTVDEAFEEAGRVRFVVAGEPGIEAVTPESIKDSAEVVYENLAYAFAERAEQAMRGELDTLRSEAADANQETSRLRAQLREFRALRDGRSVTTASRQQQLRLDQLIDRSLDLEIKLDEKVELLTREIDRKKWATLTRVR